MLDHLDGGGVSLNQKLVAIIIPIRARSAKEDGILRLQRLIKTIPSCFEIVVVDDGSQAKAKDAIAQTVKMNVEARLVYLNTAGERFSLARARNEGAKAAAAPVVIFHDVDFIGVAEVYSRIHELVKQKGLDSKPEKFFCIPIGFLKKRSTKEYLKDFEGSNNIDFWAYEIARKENKHKLKFYVPGSSCIVMNKADLLDMGGHDESYDGHGAEDFELLHRLSSRYPIKERPVDYTLNTGSGEIKEYRGFRAYFALYGEQVVEEKVSLVHLYHPTRLVWGYYQHKRNFTKLKELMEQDCSI